MLRLMVYVETHGFCNKQVLSEIFDMKDRSGIELKLTEVKAVRIFEIRSTNRFF